MKRTILNLNKCLNRSSTSKKLLSFIIITARTMRLLITLTILVISLPLLSQDNALKENNQSILNNTNIQSQIFYGPGFPNTNATTTVLPGNNSTSSNGRAPQGTRRFINTKYIITAAEMTASGFTGVVNSVGWRWNVPSPPAAIAPASQSGASTGNLRVYLKDTVEGALTIGGTFIDTTGAGYTKIIDGTISIPSGLAEINIDVPADGPGTALFTPTPGNGVILIFVYKTTDSALRTPIGAPNVFSTNVGAGTKLLQYQSQTAGGSVGAASVFRPETRFGVMTFANDITTTAIIRPSEITFIPNLAIAPKAIFKNLGTANQTNIPVTCVISSAGYSSTKNIPILNSEDSIEVTFDATYNPIDTGISNVKVFSILATDQNKNNDTLTKQIQISQSGNFCFTPSDIPDYLQTISTDQLQLPPAVSCCIRIFIHVMRKSDGTGGQTTAEVNEAIRVLKSDFVSHNICFNEVGRDFVDNTADYNKSLSSFIHSYTGKFAGWGPGNTSTQWIDIYLFANNSNLGAMSAWIPSTALVIGGNFFGTNVASSHFLSHEMGHCLGLYHTFHGFTCEPATGPELINGNLCTYFGDFVCDTPPDPTFFNVDPITCLRNPSWAASCFGSNTEPITNLSYNPNLKLIMSLVPPNCMTNHSAGQGSRAGYMIANNPLLKATLETGCFTADPNGGSGDAKNEGDRHCKYYFANSIAPLTLYPSRPTYSWENDPPCKMKLIENGVNQAGTKLVGGMDDGYFKLSLKEIQILCNSDTSKRLKLCGTCYDSLFISTNGIIGFTNHTPYWIIPNLSWLDYPGNSNNSFCNGDYNRPAIYPFWLNFDFSYPGSTGGINGITCGIKNNQLIITYSRAKVFNEQEYVSFQVCYELVNCVLGDNANIKFTYSSAAYGRTSPGFITRYKNSNAFGPNIGPYLIGIASMTNAIIYRKTDGFGHMSAIGPCHDPKINRPIYSTGNSGLSVEFGPNPFQLGRCKCNNDNYCPPECLTTTLNVSTGYNHKTSVLYPPGSVDEYWQLYSSSLSIVHPRLAGVVSGMTPNPWCGVNNGCSNWISVYPSGPWPNYPQGTQQYGFQTCFYLCDTSTVNINLSVLTDDGGFVFLDGVFIGGPTGFGCNIVPINYTNLLTKGEHFIQVLVTNPGGGPMGINVCGNITGHDILKHECWNCTQLIKGGKGKTQTGPFKNAEILLADPKSPYPIVHSGITYSDSAGNLSFQFPEPISGGDYYLVLKSENTIETWSANPVSITEDSINYDFTSSASQAYGNNMILVNGKWCFYSGDVNQNGVIDIEDIALIDNDVYNFVNGIVATDLNNDGIVDALDLFITDNNAFNYVSKSRP